MRSEARAGEPEGAADGLGMVEYGFWAFLLIAVGRVNQLVPGIGSLPLAKLFIALSILALFWRRRESGKLPPDSRAIIRTGIYLIVLALALTPFSFWLGASFKFVTQAMPVLIAMVFLALAMRSSWKSLRGTLLVLVGSGVILAGFSVLHYSGGRADASGTEYDPNDLAYVIVTLVPLATAFFLCATERVYQLIYGFMTAILVIGLLLTESRGGLLGFLTVVALIALAPMKAPSAKDSRKARKSVLEQARILVAVVCVGGVVWTQLPSSAQERFETLLHLSNDYDLNMQDKTGRGDIWLRGLRASVERPIGYGPDSYLMVDIAFGGKWKVAHNSLLEVLVELGVPGLLLFLRMYLQSARGLQRFRAELLSHESRAPVEGEQAVFARALQIALAGNIVAGFFLSDAYSEILWVIFGCGMALLSHPPGAPVREPVAALALERPRLTKKKAVRAIGRRPAKANPRARYR